MTEIELNKVFNEDCLDFMRNIPDNYIDLIYADPPFFTNNKFKDYNDKWKNNQEYYNFMKIRIIEMYRILKNSGSIYLHCDYHANYIIRCILEKIFKGNFINEIIWCYKGGNSRRVFRKKHDTIFLYSKTKDYTFNIDNVRIPYSEKIIKGSKIDEKGKQYYQTGQNKSGKVYLHSKGQLLYDYWIDILSGTTSHGKEFIGYDTQKPEKLLERIITCSSNINDIVFDPFLGSGTTAVVAKRLNRKYLGCDINCEAIKTTSMRLK